MKNPPFTIERAGFSGCCGIDILFGFSDYWGHYDYSKSPIYGDFVDGKRAKAMTDEDWINLILSNNWQLRPMYSFAGATWQNEKSSGEYHCNPFKLKAWLEKQGETVIASEKAKNHGGDTTIQAFFWTPSKGFRKNITKLVKEKHGRDLFIEEDF